MFELDPQPPVLHQFLVVRIDRKLFVKRKLKGKDVLVLEPADPSLAPTPNARRHWRSIAKDNAEWKETARHVAQAALDEWMAKHGLGWRPVMRCTVSVALGLPDKRNRDLDNLIASTKPLLDGIVAAGVIVDDSITVIQKMEFGAVVNGTTETIITIDEIVQ